MPSPALAGARSAGWNSARQPLSVYLTQNDVDAADDGNHVGNEASYTHLRERLKVHKAWQPLVHTPGIRRAVRDYIEADLSFGRLNRHIRLSHGRPKSFCPKLEMVDHRFHGAVQLMARGRNDFAIIYVNRAVGHLLERLLDDLAALAHFGHAHTIPIVNIPKLSHRNTEIKFLVAAIWDGLAEIMGYARSTQRGSAYADCIAILRRDNANPLGSLSPNWVLVNERFILVHPHWKLVDKPLALLGPTLWDVAPQTSRHDPGRHHAHAGHHLIEVIDFLPLTECEKEDRHGANVQRVSPQPNQ